MASKNSLQALDLLLEQFKGQDKPNLYALITALVDQLQDIEEGALELKSVRSIDNSEGVQLDILGLLIGVDREGRTDAEYRLALKNQIFINTSSGEPESIITFIEFLTDGTEVILKELFPAAFQVYTNGPVFPSNIHQLINNTRAAGVENVLVTSSVGETPVFSFDNLLGLGKGFAYSKLEPGAEGLALNDGTDTMGLNDGTDTMGLNGGFILVTYPGEGGKFTLSCAVIN
jgi:hypothetical protein